MKEEITSEVLRGWLATHKSVLILDIRPLHQREVDYIEGSLHLDVYDKLVAGDPTVFNEVNFDPTVLLVTVCAGGKLSLTAAALLRTKGFNAMSLQGGMNAWSEEQQ
ncbi:rhodanese-like domain-containing protein [Myroides sp. WP-1]|uniref:rhodanese-like domain-containing protein n=1 Tax=Myroides sp. WP-1 TaxID=2759944 RepID=UPI0015FE432A|nr:rhodanese-like domain-containing protein [Myroides sp. WP-1]MBB1139917.1 rhodanese-like domain-containing protein [Myroides sp. WP-1]